MKKSLYWLSLASVMCACGVHAQQHTVTYIYTDAQGTPLAEADAQGNVTATFDYHPYGRQALGQSSAGPGYTGHVNDPDTGLVYMQARYYDPDAGRFLSADPTQPKAGSIGNFSRYPYAGDNPVANIDPDGRDILVIAGGRNTGSPNVFGHVASAVQGYGVASYGNNTPLGSSATQYIQSQSENRDQTVTIIPTSSSQDSKATNFIQSTLNQNTTGLIDNCAVKVNLILNAAGVATNDIPFPGGTSRDAASLPGATTYLIPKNGEIPKELQSVLPQFDGTQPATTPPPPPQPTPTTSKSADVVTT
jgi:RHS repeat-associated protein